MRCSFSPIHCPLLAVAAAVPCLLAVTSPTLASTPPSIPNTTAASSTLRCNGYPELCSRPYSSVLQLVTHNAFAVGKTVSSNQHNPIVTQLADGVRGLALDAHKKGNVTELCHFDCSLLDAGSLVDSLRKIGEWMKSSDGAREVVSLFFENVGKFTAADFNQALQAAGSLDQMAFAKNPADAWPTLGDMIASGKRLVVFVDDIQADPALPYILAQFSHSWDTPYEIDIVSGQSVSSVTWPCNQLRPTPPQGPPSPLYFLNHFTSRRLPIASTDIPSPTPDVAPTVNSAALLTGHINKCRDANAGVMAGFVAVDFYETGDALQVVAQMNGVQWNGKVTKGGASGTSAKKGTAAAVLSGTHGSVAGLVVILVAIAIM